MSPQNPTPIRVLLVNDHRIVLWGLERLIESAKPRMEVVGSAPNCTEALKLADKVFPDVIVLDIDLGEGNGLSAIAGLIAKSKARVLVLTRSRDQAIHDNAVLAGASGIVKKREPAETILKAIEKVHAGQLWLDRIATGRIFVALSRKSTAEEVDPDHRKISTLTSRERAIIAVMAANVGANAQAVADMLHISEHTLRNHLTSIHGKLEVANRLELFVYANKHGLAKPA
jgi:two-component system, NarL family, nitrate/nitrite response regulator NarL